MRPIYRFVVRRGYRIGCRLLPVLPKWPGELAVVRLLNAHLREELEDGEFDFLEGRVLEVVFTDFRISLRIGMRSAHFVRAPVTMGTDATIAANALDFLGIASGQEDPDTLFFQRRLNISGDTEFGLTAKNRLDAVDRDRLPQRVQRCLLAMAGALAEVTIN